MKKIVSRILSGIGLLCVAFVLILFAYLLGVAIYETKEITGCESILWIIPGVIVAYIIGWLLE